MSQKSPSFDVFGLGHCCVDELLVLDPFPETGKKGEVVESLTISGGPIPTALATVVKFGNSACFCGKVGADSYGELIQHELSEAGLDIRHLQREKSTRTACAHIWINRRDGSRTIALDRTGLSWITAAEFDVSPISNARVFYCDVREPSSALKGFETARSAGVTTMIDCGGNRPKLREMLPLVDFTVVSHEFADSFLSQYALDQHPDRLDRARVLADELLKAGTGVAVITLGEMGSLAVSGDRESLVSGISVEPIVDTTGAGDVFHGGFIHGLLAGWEMAEILRFANIAGGLACRKLSGMRGIPTLNEVTEIYHATHPTP